jgi:hypothetical protein
VASVQEQESKSVTDDASRKAFISESCTVLNQLATAIKAQLTPALMEIGEQELADLIFEKMKAAEV